MVKQILIMVLHGAQNWWTLSSKVTAATQPNSKWVSLSVTSLESCLWCKASQVKPSQLRQTNNLCSNRYRSACYLALFELDHRIICVYSSYLCEFDHRRSEYLTIRSLQDRSGGWKWAPRVCVCLCAVQPLTKVSTYQRFSEVLSVPSSVFSVSTLFSVGTIPAFPSIEESNKTEVQHLRVARM